MSQPLTIDTTSLCKSNLDVKQWINETLREHGGATSSMTPDAHVAQLLTRMQLHQQEVSSTLEDLITQAVVRLPRAALEVERMASEAQSLSIKLTECSKGASQLISAIPSEAESLQRLRQTKDKLSYCSKILQKAKMLNLQLDELENVARAGPSASLRSNRDGSGISEMESIANAVADVHASLREVQVVDPNFGTAMESRLRTLETDLQQNVERECLELMKKQDTVKAPKLLAALRKIQRDTLVMQQYLNYLVSNKKNALITELRPSVGGSQKDHLPVVFSQYYRALGKFIQKELEYIHVLFVDADQAATHDLVESTCNSTFETVMGLLKGLQSNDDIVRCFKALQSDIVKGATSQTANSSDVSEKIFSLVEFSKKPYTALIDTFSAREVSLIENWYAGSQDLDGAQFRSCVEKSVASLDRCVDFFAPRTVPVVIGALLRALGHALDALSTVDSDVSSPSAIRVQNAFRRHNSLISATKSLTLLSDPVSGWISGTLRAHPELDVCLGEIDRNIREMESQYRDRCVQGVCATMLEPFSSMIQSYTAFHLWSSGDASRPKTLVAFHPGQVAPSDLIRQFGAELMELPMTLDAVEAEMNGESSLDGDGVRDDAQTWLGRVVDRVVTTFLQSISSIVIQAPPQPASDTSSQILRALEQLICDLEYLTNVLSAVSESNFGDSLGEAVRKIQKKFTETQLTAKDQLHSVSLCEVLK